MFDSWWRQLNLLNFSVNILHYAGCLNISFPAFSWHLSLRLSISPMKCSRKETFHVLKVSSSVRILANCFVFLHLFWSTVSGWDLPSRYWSVSCKISHLSRAAFLCENELKRQWYGFKMSWDIRRLSPSGDGVILVSTSIICLYVVMSVFFLVSFFFLQNFKMVKKTHKRPCQL